MKLVGVIAAGLIAGLVLPPATAHAQGAAAAARRAQQEAQQPRPKGPPPKEQPKGNRDNRADRERRPDVVRPPPQRLISLNQAVDSVRRSTPGHLLDASPPSGNRPVYVIRWQADSGQRIDFVVDAQTGAIVGR